MAGGMKYKGYIGSAEVSLEDKVVFGKVLYISDLVTYEADTPAELQSAFEEAVNEYIKDCAERTTEVTITITVPLPEGVPFDIKEVLLDASEGKVPVTVTGKAKGLDL